MGKVFSQSLQLITWFVMILYLGTGGGLGTGGLALAYQCQQSGRVRACVESVLVLSLMKKLRPLVEAEDLTLAFTKVLCFMLN